MLFLIAFVLFLLAILAKPALAVLPAVVLILIWWERGKVSVADFKALSPMLLVMLLTFAAACVNFHHRADIVEQHLSPLKRILIVGPAIWFYLDDIFRPGTFSFVYGRWDPFAWQNAALLLLDLAIILTLWLLHRRIGRAPLACAKLFFTLLVPQILFLDLNQQRDSFVADSVLYLAIVAIIVPAVAVADRWLERSMRSAAPWIGRGVVAAVMAMSFWVSLAYAGPDQLWARDSAFPAIGLCAGSAWHARSFPQALRRCLAASSAGAADRSRRHGRASKPGGLLRSHRRAGQGDRRI